MKLRAGEIRDLAELQQLFVDTVTEVCRSDYNNEQIAAWVSGTENLKRWSEVLTKQLVLVALRDTQISGFCTLANGHYIDLFYVHKDFQRQGVASLLYTEVEKEARRRGSKELTAEVSKTAKGFFESMGFEVRREQTVLIKGVELVNYKMTKRLIF